MITTQACLRACRFLLLPFAISAAETAPEKLEFTLYDLILYTLSAAENAPDNVPVNLPPPSATPQHVLVGTLSEVRTGPVGQSMPPLYTYTLTFQVDDVLRGDLPVGEKVSFQYSERTPNPTVFQNQQPYVLSARRIGERLELQNLRLAEDAPLDLFRSQAQIPAGWQMHEGKLYSPWAGLPDAAWPHPVADNLPTCAATGRPAYALPPGVTFEVKPVPPETEIEWTNPDGDGDYEITLTNTTEQPVTLQALPARDGTPLWAEAVILQIQHRAYPAPGATGNWADTEATHLPPGESISGILRPISVEGPQWPRGGSRVILTFLLAERMHTESFYYMSRHHDDLR